MAKANYEYDVDIVTKRYCDAVDHQDLSRALDCFHPQATLKEMTRNTAHVGRDAGIKIMFEGLSGAHSRLWHGNVVHTGDVEDEAVCRQFSVEVTRRVTNQELRYENNNLLYLKDGKFERVIVSMSGDNLQK